MTSKDAADAKRVGPKGPHRSRWPARMGGIAIPSQRCTAHAGSWDAGSIPAVGTSRLRWNADESPSVRLAGKGNDMSRIVWDSEHGWHDGEVALVDRDDKGRIRITPVSDMEASFGEDNLVGQVPNLGTSILEGLLAHPTTSHKLRFAVSVELESRKPK